ncbi:hypothetical protein [Bifidobacterium longum]|uniref:hypothetical protein n=1 Tax=Bifidobacterium longum TaxID=216816 RepID=UPI00103F42C3|nr:hypothetical protein [Bifidobacterium longum]TCF40717.1 hypothetical protein MCC10101_1768 [Bifidobacterium longum subsp. longum]
MTQQKNTRRPNGSGSEWRDDNGVWHAKKSAGVNPRTGRRRWIEAQAQTKTAARQKLQTKLDKLQREGDLPLADIPTLDVWID